MDIQKVKRWLLIVVPIVFLTHCSSEPEKNTGPALELKRVGGIVIQDSSDQFHYMGEGLQVIEELDIAYGLDRRIDLPFKFSLLTGDLKFLSSRGRGPEELSLPSQLTVKNSREIFVYDTSQDMIAQFLDDQIVAKLPGYTRNNIWLRHPYGHYWENSLFTPIKDPQYIQNLDFDRAKPIARFHLEDNTMTKHGIVSPTIDRLDTSKKYPIIRLDTSNSSMYYIFKADYTILKLDLQYDTTYVVSDYMPSKFRKRSISVNQVSSLSLWDAARKLGTDSSNLFSVEFIDGDLLVVWYNLTDKYYDTRDHWDMDYYGVLFDLPDFRNPREFSLPGKHLGMYRNNLMILENDDPLEFTIGYYELANR